MFYRIELSLNFETQDPVDDILDKVRDHLLEAKTINPDEPNQERSYYVSSLCTHNQAHLAECTPVESWHSQP